MSPTPTDPNQAQAWITGDPPDQTIDFYIPRGNTGPMGPQGPIGPSVSVGEIVVTNGPPAPGTVGPQGGTGPKGDPGGFVAATSLVANTDLNNIVTPGTYRNSDTASATLANNFPIAGVSGNIIVIATGPSVVTQILYPINGAYGSRMMFMRSYNTNSWTPWRTFNSSRIDQTAGRAMYQWDEVNLREQLVYGDTGWRDISASNFVAGAGGSFLIRRMTGMVQASISATLPEGLAGGTVFATIPSGFSPNNISAAYAYTRPSASLTQVTYRIQNGSGISLSAPTWVNAWGALNIHMQWFTNDAWPVALPGTANGTIPNA